METKSALEAFGVARARFAPSPTGYLHVGGARTALFNYLLARRLDGKFVLRIEDTDQTRNISGAADKLMDDLRWLGLNWDEGPRTSAEFGPYHQSERLAIYTQHARRLLDEGKAYYAFDTTQELEALRSAAQKAKQNFRYPRPRRFPSQSEADKARSEGRPVVVRLKMPPHGFTVRDVLLGDVTIAEEALSDFVLVKSDGWPTYHFAVVVDDELMRCTHVLRGQEHLMNTPNHLALQEALGYHTPVYAHLPIILNMDGSKMSKREKDRAVRAAAEAAIAAGTLDVDRLREISGAPEATLTAWRAGDTQLESEPLRRLARALTVSLPEIEIHDFRASGYLPEVLTNFIALLGWSPGEDREKMTLAEMCESFSLERIGKTNARFDRAKLLNFNTTALAAAAPQRRLEALRDYVAVNEGGPLAAASDESLDRLLRVCDGVRTLRDVETKGGALFAADDALSYDADAVQAHMLKNDAAGLGLLREARAALAEEEDWSAAALDQRIRGLCESRGVGLGKAAQPIRIAVTGTTVSPPIFDTLALLGKARTLARIDRALKRIR
jgi:glutamyl/glutaminyl-tRNA synthetase